MLAIVDLFYNVLAIIIAARILFDAGVSNDADDIMKTVRTARNGAIENRIQEEWVREIEKC